MAKLPPAHRERATRVLTRVALGWAYWTVSADMDALRLALSRDPRWWELDLLVQLAQLRHNAAVAVLRQLKELGALRPVHELDVELLAWAVGEKVGLQALAALARSEDRRVAQAASTCLAVARGERPAQETLTRQALEPDAHPVLLALAASSAEVVRARAALTERWGCLNPFVPVFCLDAAVDLINSRGAAAVRDFELLRENLYQLEQSMVALSNPQLWTSAIRLAARLPREDPWRRSLRSWQWELEHLLREHPARVAFARSHVNAATGIQRLVHGETEARVRDAWEGAALAHWELEAFRSRFGHPYAEDR